MRVMWPEVSLAIPRVTTFKRARPCFEYVKNALIQYSEFHAFPSKNKGNTGSMPAMRQAQALPCQGPESIQVSDPFQASKL